MSNTDQDAIKFNIRRSSIPINFPPSRRVSLAAREEKYILPGTTESLNDDPKEILTPLDHLEMLLSDMNDFCEYGGEILNSLKETRKEYDWFKHLYNKNRELKNKIVQLKELNEELFDEVFKYIKETNIFIESKDIEY